jgi:prepilin-type N-terminal cleavage/methylation domain-containing protein
MKLIKKAKGFTLIELLVVVAIIGILATVVLSSLGTARNRAKDAALKAGLKQFQTQVEVQYNGNYNDACDPTSESGQMYRDLVLKANFENVQHVCHDQNQNYFSLSAGDTNLIGLNSSGPDSNGSYFAAILRTFNGTWICVDSNGNFTETTTDNAAVNAPLPVASDRSC